MKQGTVKFSKEFITPIGLKEWVGIEWPVDFDNDNVMDAFNQAKKAVCDFQSTSLGNIELPSNASQSIINVERTSDDKRVAELIRDIYACTEIEGDNGLLTYNKLASTCKEAQQAFDIMFRKLAPKNG